MKKFITIDWDFFVGASDSERALLFPDGGNENLPPMLKDYIWDSHYSNPALLDVGIHEDQFNKVWHMVSKLYIKDFVVLDSHKFMYDFVKRNVGADEEFMVVNIDFHHDLYNFPTEQEPVNCGNWARVLLQEYPKMKYFWVKQEDSDDINVKGMSTELLFEDFIKFFKKNFISGDPETYVYMCRSSMWSPPHLDKYFVSMLKHLLRVFSGDTYLSEKGISEPRKYEIPTPLSELLATQEMFKLHKK